MDGADQWRRKVRLVPVVVCAGVVKNESSYLWMAVVRPPFFSLVDEAGLEPVLEEACENEGADECICVG